MSPAVVRKSAAVLIVAALPLFWAGCGGGETHDPQTQYTPESIAAELAFRFRDLAADARKLKTKARPDRKAAVGNDREAAKTAEATKEAAPNDADAVLADVEKKIRAQPGSLDDFCKKVVENLRKDSSLSDAEKDDLARRIEAIPGGK